MSSELQSSLEVASRNAQQQLQSWYAAYRIEWAEMIDLRVRPMRGPAREQADGEQSVQGDATDLRVSDLASQLSAGRQTVLVGPAGAGKTTALLQIAQRLLSDGTPKVPAFVSLAEWSTLQHELLEHVAALLGVEISDVRRISESGDLVLLLNGWNEVAFGALPWARRALSHALRQLPNACVVLTTREHEKDAPLPRAEWLTIQLLTDAERRDMVARVGATSIGAIADHLEQDNALDVLTRVPLLLRVALAVVSEGKFVPATEHGLLSAFVERVEAGEHRVALLAACGGWHRAYLEDIAAHLTDAGSASLPVSSVVTTIGATSKRLKDDGLLGSIPDAFAILQALSAHHLLVSDQKRFGVVSFVHPLFQAWFAAEWLGGLLSQRRSEAGHRSNWDASQDRLPREALAARVNRVPWRDAVVLLGGSHVERVDEPGIGEAHEELIEASMEVDLVLGCELLGRGIRRRVMPAYVSESLSAMYTSGTAEEREYALAAMLATRAPEFADFLWSELQGTGRESSWRFGDWGQTLSLSSLGEGWWKRLRARPEQERLEALTQIARSVNPAEGRALLSLIAQEESTAVRLALGLEFDLVGESGLALELLRTAPGSWSAPSARQLLHHLPKGDVSAMKAELRAALAASDDSEVRVDLLSILHRSGDATEDEYARALRKAVDDAHAASKDAPATARLLKRLADVDASGTGDWVLSRILEGASTPRDWFYYVANASTGRLTQVLEQLCDSAIAGTPMQNARSLLWVFAKVRDMEVTRALARSWVKLLRALWQSGSYVGRSSPWLEEIYRDLSHALREQPYAHRLEVILGLDDLPRDGGELHELYRLLTPESAFAATGASDVSPLLRQEFRNTLFQWEARLKTAGELDRGSRSNLAVLLGQLGEADDVRALEHWIADDLSDWEREIAERQRGALRNVANVSYTNWYAGALASLASDEAAEALIGLLRHPFYLGDASQALAHLVAGDAPWRFAATVRRNVGSAVQEGLRPSTTPVRRPPRMPSARERFGAAIVAAIEGHLTNGGSAGRRPYAHDLGRAAGALGRLRFAPALPLLFRLGKVDYCEWEVLQALESIALDGAMLPARETREVVDTYLARLGDPRRTSGQDTWPTVVHGIALLLLSDDPAQGVDRIRQVLPSLNGSYRMRDIVALLGESDTPEAERALVELFQDSSLDTEREAEVLKALAEHRGEVTAQALERALDELIASENSGRATRRSSHELLQTMTAAIRSNARFRQAVFRRVSMAQSTSVRVVLLELLRQLDSGEAAVAACQLLADPLPSELPYGIREWLEGAITSREPAGSAGAYWLRPRAANAVRRRLFELMMTDAERSRAARRALLVIENHRVRFGRPADECCHPAGAAPSTWREEFPSLRGQSWILEGVTGSRTT